jgi:hypothetical protein
MKIGEDLTLQTTLLKRLTGREGDLEERWQRGKRIISCCVKGGWQQFSTTNVTARRQNRYHNSLVSSATIKWLGQFKCWISVNWVNELDTICCFLWASLMSSTHALCSLLNKSMSKNMKFLIQWLWNIFIILYALGTLWSSTALNTGMCELEKGLSSFVSVYVLGEMKWHKQK